MHWPLKFFRFSLDVEVELDDREEKVSTSSKLVVLLLKMSEVSTALVLA